MPKTQTRYVCQECGRVAASYMGKCPHCESFNTMWREAITNEPVTKVAEVGVRPAGPAPRSIGDVSSDTEDRINLPIGEFARVLGGGIVPGSIVLVSGDPGIGKSTLMLQMAMEMAARKRVLYVSGEESERQIKMRAVRLAKSVGAQQNDQRSNAKNDSAVSLPANLLLVTETNLEII